MIRKAWFAAVVSALAAFFAYLPALKAEFVWDDSVVQTLQIPYFKTVGDAFRPPRRASWSGAGSITVPSSW